MAYRLQIHPYFLKSASRSSWDCDFRCDFHPGHHRMCHFHSRPRNDWGDLSYFALKAHLSQLLMGFSFDDGSMYKGVYYRGASLHQNRANLLHLGRSQQNILFNPKLLFFRDRT